MQRLNRAAIAQAKAILGAMVDEGRGVDAVLAPMRVLAEEQGWLWFGLASRQEFNKKCARLASSYAAYRHSEGRLAQLREGDFALWVYRADEDCGDDHSMLEGLCLRPDHDYWQVAFPPLSLDCGCYVVGARTDRSAERLGGNLGLRPPDPAIFGEDNDEPLTWRSRLRLSQDESLIALLKAIIELDNGAQERD